MNLLVGFLLLGLARALSVKVKKAFLPTIALLSFGILNTITRTLSWQLILVYVLILLAVWLSRKEFYRTKFVYSWGAIIFDASLFGFLFIVYAIAGYHSGRFLVGRITGNHFILFPSDDVWFSGLIGLGISLLALVALYQYLAEDTTKLGSEYEKDRFDRLLKHTEAQLQAISFACQVTVIFITKKTTKIKSFLVIRSKETNALF